MINDERHRFSRRVWDPLISGVGADVGRDSGDLDYFNPSGFTRIPAVAGRRGGLRGAFRVCGAAESGRAGTGVYHRGEIYRGRFGLSGTGR